ncbi:hypothetical protein CYMTET_12701 [Cymbomonas tetramitiformis]|uniref:Uncharacterized protein n=1 Tax=Cymbomonas tetramitiformis TaxID=36881 RepID=A0AAE0F1L9_9CHLO|nr:hypothetical protein CYMTET_43484 [Cymbomonas tetramitiformis]KAK3279418.1 hypothetical protein CYMTET_12701 [Cymbomonas tetramitiformis]
MAYTSTQAYNDCLSLWGAAARREGCIPGGAHPVVDTIPKPHAITRRTFFYDFACPTTTRPVRSLRPGLVVDDDVNDYHSDLEVGEEDCYDHSADSDICIPRTTTLSEWFPVFEDDFLATHNAAARRGDAFDCLPGSSWTAREPPRGHLEEGGNDLETEQPHDSDEEWSLCSELDEYREDDNVTPPEDFPAFLKVGFPALGRISQHACSYAEAVASTSLEFDILDDNQSETSSVWSSFSAPLTAGRTARQPEESTTKPKLAAVEEAGELSCFDDYEAQKSFGARGFSNKVRGSVQRQATRAKRLEANAAHVNRQLAQAPWQLAATPVSRAADQGTQRRTRATNFQRALTRPNVNTARTQVSRLR